MTEIERLREAIYKADFRQLVFDLDETVARLQLPWPKGYALLYEAAPNHIERQLREDFGRGESYGVVLNRAVEQHEEFLPILLAWAHDFEASLEA